MGRFSQKGLCYSFEILHRLLTSKDIRIPMENKLECVRCPWLLAQTKVATIFDIFPHVLLLVLTLLPFNPEGIVVGF